MRINTSEVIRKKQRFYHFRWDIPRAVKAGRVFASQCKADYMKNEYGFEDIPLMQKTLDQLYPGEYSIQVWTTNDITTAKHTNDIPVKHTKSHLIRIFDGGKRKATISLIMFEYDGKKDFFGLRSVTEKSLKKHLHFGKPIKKGKRMIKAGIVKKPLSPKKQRSFCGCDK